MLKINYSSSALRDLQQLEEYILENWGKQISNKIIKEITSDIRSLEQFPLLGVVLGKMLGIPTDYRYLFTAKNYVFYRQQKDEILIIRVLNEKQNFIDRIFNDKN